MNTVRVGKPRNHKEGISLNVFHDFDDTEECLLATVYGADESEAQMRGRVVACALGEHYGSKVRT